MARATPTRTAMSDLAALALVLGERCADCHQSIVESYARTGMARALGPIEPGELADLAAVDDAAGWRYRLEQDARGARIVESRADSTAGAGSAAAAELAYELAFAIGAGELDRSFAARHGVGLAFAPLEVVSAGAGAPRHAALAPGHSIEPGLRLANPITPECLACHTDELPAVGYPLNVLANALAAAEWKPRGIGCGACHARAGEHAAWREREAVSAAPEASRDPILDHGALDRVGRVSVCAACHLQGDARIELSNERLGPPEPGADLLAARAVFVARDPGAEIGFVSQVERLVLSRCYTASGAMSCESCHDAHATARGESGAAERARVRAACSTCHATPGGGCALPAAERAARDCVECHMPLRGTFDVAGVEIHDHWIRARPEPAAPAKPLRLLESAGGPLALFAWPDRPPQPHAADPGLWMMAEAKAGRVASALVRAREPPGPAAKSLACSSARERRRTSRKRGSRTSARWCSIAARARRRRTWGSCSGGSAGRRRAGPCSLRCWRGRRSRKARCATAPCSPCSSATAPRRSRTWRPRSRCGRSRPWRTCSPARTASSATRRWPRAGERRHRAGPAGRPNRWWRRWLRAAVRNLMPVKDLRRWPEAGCPESSQLGS
jgi:cytochrome c1